MKWIRFAVMGLALAGSAAAQEKGTWRAASPTARSITGDVAFSSEKLTIDFAGFTIAQIRDLKPAEIVAAFGEESAGAGNLYRLSIPATKMFLHKNTLCGSDETQWMATFVAGKSLRLAFFSGAQMPVLTFEALDQSATLCGSFAYVR